MYCWICFSFESSMMYFPVRLLIFTVWYLINSSSLLIVRSLRWKYVRGSPSPRRKVITRSWYLGPSTPMKLKSIVTMHVCKNSDMWFWCFCWGDGGIFNKNNSEWSWECFKIFFCCSIFRMCVFWEEKFNDVVMFCVEFILWWSALVCWQRLE